MSLKTKGIILGVISGMSWGTYGVFITWLGDFGMDPMTVVALAPTVMWVFFLIKILIKDKSMLKVKGKPLVALLIQGIAIVNLMNICYVNALETVPVGIVSICAFCNVIIMMFTMKIFFSYKFTSHKIIAIIVAVIGVCLVLQVFSESGAIGLSGIGWALAIPFVLATGYTLQKYVLVKGIDGDAILFYINFFAAITIYISQVSPVAMVQDIASVVSLGGGPAFLVVLGFAAIPQVICFYTFIKAYQYIDPTYVSVCYGLDPVVASVLGLLIFQQFMGVPQVFGIILVIAAILFIQWREGKEAPDQLSA